MAEGFADENNGMVEMRHLRTIRASRPLTRRALYYPHDATLAARGGVASCKVQNSGMNNLTPCSQANREDTQTKEKKATNTCSDASIFVSKSRVMVSALCKILAL